jgi:hypothetical protein
MRRALGIARYALLAGVVVWGAMLGLGIERIIDPGLALGVGVYSGVVIGVSAFVCAGLQIAIALKAKN